MDKIFNRNLLRVHRDFAASNIAQHDFLIKNSSDQIFDHVVAMGNKYQKILELGARSGFLTDKLMQEYTASKVVATDISPRMLSLNPSERKILLDEEHMEIEGDFDLITSVLNIHWINNLPGFFKLLSNHLTQDGLFVFSMFCGPSLKNLRHTIVRYESEANTISSPHISPFVDPKDLYILLQNAGFKFIVLDIENIEVEYDSPISLMKELKAMGESNNLFSSHNMMSRHVIERLSNNDSVFIDNFQIATVIARLNDTKFPY